MNKEFDRLTVLLIEDNPTDKALIEQMLYKNPMFRLISTVTLTEGIRATEKHIIDAAILDLFLSDSQGKHTFDMLNAAVPHLPIIIFSSLSDEKLAMRLLHDGAQDYLLKGHVNKTLLLRSIQYAISRKKSEEVLRKTTQDLEDSNKKLEIIIGKSNQMALDAQITNIELNQIFNTSADGMWVIDNDFCILRLNNSFSKLIQTDKESIIGKKCYDIFPISICQTPQCPMNHCMHSEDRIEVDVETAALQKEYILTASVLTDFDGTKRGVIESFKDITYRKKATEDRIQKEKLQGVLEMAGAVCHELNQPLHSILGYTELLSNDLPEGHSATARLQKISAQLERLRETTSKIMKITTYKTKTYPNGKIIDIDKSSE